MNYGRSPGKIYLTLEGINGGILEENPNPGEVTGSWGIFREKKNPKEIPREMLKRFPIVINEGISGGISEAISEGIPDKIPIGIPGRIVERIAK